MNKRDLALFVAGAVSGALATAGALSLINLETEAPPKKKTALPKGWCLYDQEGLIIGDADSETLLGFGDAL